MPFWKKSDRSAENTTSSMVALKHFTPKAQQVLALARREAERFQHNFVGTEHLLLAIIALRQGIAATALANMGLDLEKVRMEVERHVVKFCEA